MNDLLTSENLLAWVAQTSVLVAVAAILGRAMRVRSARWHSVYLHALLFICVLLPALQRWDAGPRRTRPVSQGSARASGAGASADTIPLDVTRYLPFLLCAGIAGRTIWLCLGMIRLRQYRRSSQPLDGSLASVQAAAHLTGSPAQFAVSRDISGPVTFGFVSPIVLVPPSFRELADEHQLAIACHELVHVRRGDWIKSLAEEFTAAVLWFHPGIWWLLRQLRLAREQAVDQSVVALTGMRESYVRALLKIAETRWQLDLSPAPLFLRRRHLMDRVHQLLKESTMSRSRIAAAYASTFALLGTTAWFASNGFPLTAAPYFAQQQSEDPKPEFQPSEEKRLRLSREIMQEKLIDRKRPAYPPVAKETRTQGVVKLAVLVGKEGRVKDLYTMSGPPILQEAAEEAVRNWVYRTTLLNGDPVEVVTTVHVTFTLAP